MPPLTTEQLDAVRRLLLDPLRETVKAELQISHDRLAASVDRLTHEVSEHVARTDHRLTPLEREVGRQRNFRRRVTAVYGVLAVLVSLAWSILREKLLSRFGNGKQ